jgi:hypothetical protein
MISRFSQQMGSQRESDVGSMDGFEWVQGPVV